MIHQWIKWAFIPSPQPHRLSSFIHARQASRDLGVLVTEADFDAAMSDYAFSHKDKRGESHYFVDDSPAKGKYDFRRYVLVEPLVHPLLMADPQGSFDALPEADKTRALDWIKSSLRISNPRHVNSFRTPCNAATGLDLTEDQMRGALIAAAHKPDINGRFHRALTDDAFREHKKLLWARQPIPGVEGTV